MILWAAWHFASLGTALWPDAAVLSGHLAAQLQASVPPLFFLFIQRGALHSTIHPSYNSLPPQPCPNMTQAQAYCFILAEISLNDL